MAKFAEEKVSTHALIHAHVQPEEDELGQLVY